MSEIKIFENPEFGKVRTVELNGQPYFSGKDVAEALGYKNTKDAVANHVDDQDKRILQRSEITTLENHIPKDVFPVNFVDANIPNRGLTIINESGLYALIFGSKLESAKRFKHWVTSVILPSIRKTGGYIAGQETMSDADLMAKALLVAQRQIEQRDKQITEMQPKALFADSVCASSTSILIGELAKILKQNGVDTGQKRLFAWLRENGYLIRRKGADYNMPSQRSMEMGLFEIKETVVSHADGHTSINKTPKITGKGQVYFVNKLCGEGARVCTTN